MGCCSALVGSVICCSTNIDNFLAISTGPLEQKPLALGHADEAGSYVHQNDKSSQVCQLCLQ